MTLPSPIPPTPPLTRHRSDTILSTSSSSSYPKVQTPETPSILSRLSFAGAGHDLFRDEAKQTGKDQGSLGMYTLKRRASSYEFGALLGEAAVIERGRGTGWSGLSGWAFGADEAGPSHQEQERANMPFVESPTEESTGFHYPLPNASSTSPPDEPYFSHVPSDPPTEPPSLPTSTPALTDKPASASERRSSWFQKAALDKLPRSRSSFKSFSSSGPQQSTFGPSSQSPSIASISATSQSTPPHPHPHPKREKFQSLISFSRPRKASYSSQSPFADAPPPPPPQTQDNSNHAPSHPVPVAGGYRPWSPPPMLPSAGPSGEQVTVQRFDFCKRGPTGDDAQSPGAGDEEWMVKVDRKGKGRAVPLPPPLGLNPPMGIHNRHHNLPLPAHCTPFTTGETKPKDKPVSLTFEQLPHEIRVMVMRGVMEGWPESLRTKMAGELRGRKELIRLSVSKSWESLCFDGQLWPHLTLSSFAHLLHPSTLFRILRHSSSFITHLSLRGMDKVGGYTILSALGGLSPDGLELGLETMDLQGCLGISSRDICLLVARSGRLRRLCLRSVPHVTVETLISILSNAPLLEELDVSYCSNILLPDIAHAFAHSSHHSSRLRKLRMAGVNGMFPEDIWTILTDSGVLPGLEVLDLQNCSGLSENTFAPLLSSNPTALSSLTHLNLSSTPLTPSIFTHLTHLLPNLQILQLARIHRFYDPDDDDDGHALAEMLKSMPKLRKVDLEDTAGMSGVCDLVLKVMTPGEYAYEDGEGEGEGEVVGMELEELNIGYGDVTSEAVVDLIHRCKKLRVLDVDNTSVGNTVMRAFNRHIPSPSPSSSSSSPSHLRRLSLIDCPSITSQAYAPLSPRTRPRQGWPGWQAVPFGYDPTGHGDGDEMADEKVVLKTFWSWRRVAAPKGWREVRKEAERVERVAEVEERKMKDVGAGAGAGDGESAGARPIPNARAKESVSRMKMRGSESDGLYDERVGCVIA
ncbi:hypothetical protein L198_07888 [Cryptococcus wingfieldii CBS 7118]|uniref:F-box domain-containing protein n=1 Tax=Cryptococcus wingfieldii CBS 7118 TaxID=1295528 RepID=A0A1E3HUR3_9TREE|nr:hypothetical protein L198_07888 [Cryptococcus wingfieldii CBS 7118]ODN80078.1 hypothetical protein L198_07888 [Cryptococcus wingfieldii CBS 7118]